MFYFPFVVVCTKVIWGIPSWDEECLQMAHLAIMTT